MPSTLAASTFTTRFKRGNKMGAFSAAVGEWAGDTKWRMKIVRDRSILEVIRIAQLPRAEGGRMRVDTGFLRSSLVAFVGAANPPSTHPYGPGPFRYDHEKVARVVARARLTDRITFVWTADYARAREYGTRLQAADAFARTAFQLWPQIVEEQRAWAWSRKRGGG